MTSQTKVPLLIFTNRKLNFLTWEVRPCHRFSELLQDFFSIWNISAAGVLLKLKSEAPVEAC